MNLDEKLTVKQRIILYLKLKIKDNIIEITKGIILSGEKYKKLKR